MERQNETETWRWKNFFRKHFFFSRWIRRSESVWVSAKTTIKVASGARAMWESEEKKLKSFWAFLFISTLDRSTAGGEEVADVHCWLNIRWWWTFFSTADEHETSKRCWNIFLFSRKSTIRFIHNKQTREIIKIAHETISPCSVMLTGRTVDYCYSFSTPVAPQESFEFSIIKYSFLICTYFLRFASSLSDIISSAYYMHHIIIVLWNSDIKSSQSSLRNWIPPKKLELS